MANNRLYIGDKESKTYMLVAKGWGAGWNIWNNDDLVKFISEQFNEGGLGGTTGLIFFTEYDPIHDEACKNWSKIESKPTPA